MQAAVEAVKTLPFKFTFCARAENLIRGINDLDDTIRRLQAFEKAGADVLYAPGLKTLDEVRLVTQAVGRPVNVNMSGVPQATALRARRSSPWRTARAPGGERRRSVSLMGTSAHRRRRGPRGWRAPSCRRWAR